MTVTESYVFLKDVRFHAFHGVLPQEKEVGQDFLVSIRCAMDMSSAMNHDMLEVALDYGVLYQLVKEEMDIPSQLVEHVAGRIGKTVFDHFQQVTAVDITITKLNPPLGADSVGAGVEVHLIR
jgi:dihydroneopterin aldolase